MGEKKRKRLSIFSKQPKAVELAEKSKRKVPVVDSPPPDNQEDTAISAENLPAALAAHFEQLSILEKKVRAADVRAQNARVLADSAKKKSAGFFGRKKAIESLQDSNISMAQAQAEIMDAMKVSFVYHQKISEIVNQMLLLCVSNLAGTRTLLSQLRDELKKVEKGDYSERTKAEMARIIRELEDQEDMMSKQAKQSAMLQEHSLHIRAQDEHLKQHDVQHEETVGEIARANKLAVENQQQIERLVGMLQASEVQRETVVKTQKITFVFTFVAIVLAIIGFLT